MTPEIKQRIEQIRRGEVPEGYKRTKAGVVPIEWAEVRIGDVLTQRKTLQCVSEDAPLLSFTIEEGVIDPADKKSNKRDFLIKDMATKKFSLTEVGDIIYNPANLKFGAIHRNNLRRGVVSPIYGIFYGEQDSTFMGYLLHNQRFIDYAKVYTEGTVEKLKTLKAETFLKLKITLPSILDQVKIAEILSAQEKIISLKEKIIKEKKVAKKAIAQRLLAGKTRLKNFSTPWRKVTFGDCIKEIDERTTQNNQYNILSVTKDGIVYQSEHFNKQIASQNNSGYKIIKRDQLAFSILNLWMGSVDVLSLCDIGIVSPAYKVYECSEKYLIPDFAKYFLRSYDIVWLYNINSETGASIVRKNLDLTALLKEIIEVPSIDEQKAIANVLIAADKEIELLQRELDQEKQKKKALMQLLLTGIVRVNK